jgi:hypothetical protein
VGRTRRRDVLGPRREGLTPWPATPAPLRARADQTTRRATRRGPPGKTRGWRPLSGLSGRSSDDLAWVGPLRVRDARRPAPGVYLTGDQTDQTHQTGSAQVTLGRRHRRPRVSRRPDTSTTPTDPLLPTRGRSAIFRRWHLVVSVAWTNKAHRVVTDQSRRRRGRLRARRNRDGRENACWRAIPRAVRIAWADRRGPMARDRRLRGRSWKRSTADSRVDQPIEACSAASCPVRHPGGRSGLPKRRRPLAPRGQLVSCAPRGHRRARPGPPL